MPGQTVNQDPVRIAKNLDDEFGRFKAILWNSLGQQKAAPKRRTEMITAAFSNFKDFMVKTLAAAPAEKIVRPGTNATAGKKERAMTVTEKLQHDIAVTKRRIDALKADSPFFVQGGGKLLPSVSFQELVGKPVVDATPEDLQAALDALRETVASLLDEINVLSASAPVAKTAATDPKAGAFDGVFSRYGERRQAITELCKAAHSARVAKSAQGAVWNGVWTGRA
jgi:hypothetical protein